MVRLRKPVQIGDEASQPVHLLDDVIGCAPGGLKAIAQSLRLQQYDAQRRVQLMGDVVYQPPSELALSLQGGCHPVEGRAHPAQLVRGRDRQPGRISLGNCLGRLGQRRHRRRDPHGQPEGQQDGDTDCQRPANQDDVQQRVEKSMRLGRQVLMVHVHVHVPDRPVLSQIEHRLATSLQLERDRSGWQFGQIVPYNKSIEAGDDDSHLVPVEELRRGPLLPFGVPLPLPYSIVEVTGLEQSPVHRSPATCGGVLPTQFTGQLGCLIIAYSVYEHAQTGLRRVVAYTDARQDGEDDDKDGRTHDLPAQRHHSFSTTNL